MRKFFIILILLLFFAPIMVSAYFFADAFISEVAPQNIMEGNSVNGVLKINAACSWDEPKDFGALISYGDTTSFETLGRCPCTTAPDATEIKRVVCGFNFSHQYNTVGQYFITPSVSGGIGGGLGAPVTINVFERPTAGPGGGAGNPLSTSTIAGLVKTATNVIYVIAYMLTALLIMIGGFMIITSSGKPEQITKGRKIVLYTIIAFAILIIARGIINLILMIIDVPTRI